MPISIPTQVAGISIPGAVNGPLNLLYGNKYDKTNYRFPRDVGSNPTRQHVILFTINEPDPIQLGSTLGTTIEAGIKAVPAIVETVIEGGIPSGLRDVRDTANKIGENKDVKTVLKGVDDLTRTKLNRRASCSIALYVPDTVNVSYNTVYDDDFSLTDALGKNYFLAQGAVSLYNTFKDSGSEPLVNTINKAGNDPFVRSIIAKGIDKAFKTNIGEVALQSGGYAMNPQLQVLFRGIGFRDFQFDFVLTPYSQEETNIIKQIIEKFKYASAPEIDTNGAFNQGLFMKIPDTFDIKFMYKGAENPNVHRIGECVLKNVNVDYAGAGTWATHNDGSPVQIRLTLQFTETVIIDKKKIKEGY